ncbi:DUF4232 domain-containing protein [Streptomyces sp. NPDC091387]|uniref:DUF4232 domain-containing protein n=1 Tax=Streptomyces sp. NPDC091387 TaxID=3365998 RepID=UPI003803746F
MSAFRYRTTALAATTTAVLALALTACGGDNGTGTRSEGPASKSAHGVAKSAHGTAAKDDTPARKGAPAKTPVTAEGGTTGSASTPLCTTEDVRISAATQDGPPSTHLVLTAKNTSGHRCEMKGFPQIQFLESHKRNIPSVARSKPEAPVVLDAGAPAYALVKLSDGGADEDVEPVTAFAVRLQGGDGQATVRAPGAEGIAVDPATYRTGYWTYELRDGADDF